MTPRTLGFLSLFVWLTSLVSSLFFLPALYGGTADVWGGLAWCVDLGIALYLWRRMMWQAETAEAEADEWRARWGSEVGPHRIALARLVWAIEGAEVGKRHWGSLEEPDLLQRAERLTKKNRAATAY